jgi:hypothetical protein
MTAGTRCADACYTPNTATIQSCEIVRSEPRRKRSCGVREPAKREVHARHVTPLQRYVTHMGVNDAATTRAATTMIVYGDGTHGSGRDGQMHTRQGRVELRPSTGKRAGEKGLDGRLRGGDATRRDTRIHTQRQRRASDARGTHQRVWRRASTAVPCTRRGVHFLFVNKTRAGDGAVESPQGPSPRVLASSSMSSCIATCSGTCYSCSNIMT